MCSLLFWPGPWPLGTLPVSIRHWNTNPSLAGSKTPNMEKESKLQFQVLQPGFSKEKGNWKSPRALRSPLSLCSQGEMLILPQSFQTEAQAVFPLWLHLHIHSLGFFFFQLVLILSLVSSVTQSCPTLCDPMDCSTPGFPVHHQLLKFTQTHVHRVSDAIHPSHPLSSPSFPAPNLSQHQGLFQ